MDKYDISLYRHIISTRRKFIIKRFEAICFRIGWFVCFDYFSLSVTYKVRIKKSLFLLPDDTNLNQN